MPVKQSPEKLVSGLTTRAAFLSLIFIWIGNYWLTHTGLITHSTQIGESVPPIPAVAALICLVAVNPLLRRFASFLSFFTSRNHRYLQYGCYCNLHVINWHGTVFFARTHGTILLRLSRK